VRRINLHPTQSGQNTRERPRKSIDDIRDNRQSIWPKAFGITICIENERPNLRADTIDYVLENGLVAQETQAFISTSHTPRLATCQQNTHNLLNHHQKKPFR
jgi:hypothetical protein